MKILNLYKWIAGSMADFTNQFKNNESLYNQAKAYWDKLDSLSAIIFIILVVLGIAMAYIYYQPYNNKPGRHYHPRHWFYFLLATIILTFLVTWGFEYLAIPPKIKGSGGILLRIAFCNAIYSLIPYIIISIIWCYIFPTNAYRLFKFNKK